MQIIKEHIRCYPFMEPQDFGKLVFQSEFGPEHMISDRQQAESFLIEEWKTLRKDPVTDIWEGRQEMAQPVKTAPPIKTAQPVSKSLCRFPLYACDSAHQAKLLAHLFLATGERQEGTVKGLEEKLRQLGELRIPGMEEWAASWKREGYPPVHHSRAYRERYQPHYRLVKKEYADYFTALSEIYRLIRGGKPAVVAIDGRCGSGKTYLAEVIGRLFPCNICHMDDFYLPMEQRREKWREIPGGNMDLERFLTEVLRPVRTGGQTVVYRPYDCKRDAFGEAVQMPSVGLTVVEGSYSHHPILAAEYDLTIFLTCNREEQRKRLRTREGDSFPAFEKQWIPMEENYFRSYSIEAEIHLVIDTSDF